ncbi:MAG: DNA ligase D [Saprospiraceae bacterium]|uniref:DNA ligase (ATP) n=1 Tax=Candidatus Opimibacter skivensis TaxID=2982028 RepID=A0A9D7XNI2_9BACT|nr:DNA ligase D [Candidatus Opimibacter skivensis]
MLATLTEPFDEEGWVYEIKWDGYRALAIVNAEKSNLLSRNNKSFSEKFYPVQKAIEEWGIRAVVDGEIVVLDDRGKPDFGSLQNWRSEADGDLVYYVFDLMWLNGYDLTKVPLTERRNILMQLIPSGHSIIRMSDAFESKASDLLKAVRKMGLEGIMAKKKDSLYYPGARTKGWLKMKSNKRHEVVIGGFTQNEGSIKTFSSLLVGINKNGDLIYTGKIGTGFSDKLQKEMMKLFKPLIRRVNPFKGTIDVNKPSRFRPDLPNASATWLKPELVCEVSYTEMTSDGVMRHPSFEGMRNDKNAKDVHEEKAVSVKKSIKSKILKEIVMPSTDNSKKTLLNPSEATQVKKVNGHELKFTHVDKLFWAKEKITKGDLMNYYYKVSSLMLPYLKNRPESLNRYPDGYAGKNFYQKDVKGKAPEWATTFPYRSAEEDIDKEFLVVQEEASLLYMVNTGCIEINPWNSTMQKPDHPTWCIMDLDPDKNNFDTVIRVAQVAHEILESAGIDSYCKTSGSTGIHIYIPLNAKYTYDQSKEFARLIVTMVQKEMPLVTSIERLVPKRKGKIYLDFLQNRPQATVAAPYSVRPKPGAPVSMPLHWDELKKGLKMTDFTIKNVLPMLNERGDIFKGVLGKGIDMKMVIKKLEVM